MSNPLSSVEPWSLVAEGYTRSTKQFLEGFSLKAIELLKPQPDSVVLDVAAGPGTLAIPLARSVREIHAIDFSQAMIDQLKLGIQETKAHNVHPYRMDGQKLEFEADRFDFAFSMFGLMFFPDKLQGLKEIYRVLKPGGKVAISGWAPIANSPLMQCLFGALRKANPDIPAPQTNVQSFENPDYIREQLSSAGFQEIEILPFSNSIEVVDVKDFLDTMIDGGAPLQLMKSKMKESAWLEKERIMFEHLKEELTRLPISLSSEAYIATAKRP
ncbi:class I SAM-dependent methyltransferase [Leptospira yasudae]|uniref:Class I SAM-dependent methyltransferase n=1 Tax=Leptospira yasudae TaxID=2202201 RepID=A0A6N4QGA4_9LEPT|nr:class I SAM-dependent methyltransferase [Leptospira yasudae]TGL76788.1 class I SAM-dependent methyltransferase [Leptospira yasudae]TGL82076.1 class I SAM-dependent methyltransferase [Leptospira yasudae]TGL84221.1 class I SAM-dependent methyltransferase [Leptospira yasudae]